MKNEKRKKGKKGKKKEIPKFWIYYIYQYGFLMMEVNAIKKISYKYIR